MHVCPLLRGDTAEAIRKSSLKEMFGQKIKISNIAPYWVFCKKTISQLKLFIEDNLCKYIEILTICYTIILSDMSQYFLHRKPIFSYFIKNVIATLWICRQNIGNLIWSKCRAKWNHPNWKCLAHQNWKSRWSFLKLKGYWKYWLCCNKI